MSFFNEKGYGKEWMRVCNGLFHPEKKVLV
jgi:hypothetical protein